MLKIGINRGVHGHRLDAELATGAQHPQCDLASVCDDNLVDHGLSNYWIENSG